MLDVPGGQLVQLYAAQGGDDVLVNPPLIGHLGVGPEACPLIGLIPVVQPVTQRDAWLGQLRGGDLQTFPQLLRFTFAGVELPQETDEETSWITE